MTCKHYMYDWKTNAVLQDPVEDKRKLRKSVCLPRKSVCLPLDPGELRLSSTHTCNVCMSNKRSRARQVEDKRSPLSDIPLSGTMVSACIVSQSSVRNDGSNGFSMHCVDTHVRTGSLRDNWDSLELLGFNVSIPILHPQFLSQAIPCTTRITAGRSQLLSRGTGRRRVLVSSGTADAVRSVVASVPNGSG